MSWQAVQLVVRHGPEDHELYRVCNTIAEGCNAGGSGARLGLRLLADRCRMTLYRVRQIIDSAVDDGWLVVESLGDGTAQSVYALGPMLTERGLARDASTARSRARNRLAREIPRASRDGEHENRALSARNDAQIRARTVLPIRSKRTVAARTAQGGGSFVRSDQSSPPVPLAPPSPVDDSVESVDQNEPRCAVVSPSDFEAARAVLRPKVRPV
jgi:hypothetical protein